jgi:hypothetical protein
MAQYIVYKVIILTFLFLENFSYRLIFLSEIIVISFWLFLDESFFICFIFMTSLDINCKFLFVHISFLRSNFR